MRKLISVFLIVIFWSCQSKKNKLTFYIENGSRVDTLVNIRVLIEDKKVIDSNFVYSTITPNYDTFISEHLKKDSITILATTNTGAKNKFKIKFDKNAYVFLTYMHDSLMTQSEFVANEKMKKELKGYDPSELLEKKALKEKVQYIEPILY